MTTADALKAFMLNVENDVTPRLKWPDYAHRGFDYTVVRKPFQFANGSSASIQQSQSHYSSKADNSFELYFCPHHEILAPYGKGDGPYAYVPFDVVVAYIDAMGGPSVLHRSSITEVSV